MPPQLDAASPKWAAAGPSGRTSPRSPAVPEIIRNASLPQLTSTSQPGSPDARSKHRSKAGGLLFGVSTTAETLNTRSQKSLHKLLAGSRGEEDAVHTAASGKESQRRSDDNGKAEVANEEFADLLDGALGSIAALKRSMDNFDPKGSSDLRSPSSPTLQRSKTGSPSGFGMSREDSEKLQERIEAYKMVRKVEPELPPLQQTQIPPKPAKEPSQTDILLRNASPEALATSSVEAKRLKMCQHVQLDDLRKELAAVNRKTTVDAKTNDILKKLDQKAQQSARAVAMRRSNQPKVQQDTRDLRKDQMLEKWLAACVAGAFARQVMEEIRVRKMSDQDRMEYMAKTEQLNRMRGPNASRFLQDSAEQAQSIQGLKQEPETVRKLGELATRAQYILRRHRKRLEARCIVACLKEWRVAGRTFVALKQFAQRVVKMQQWWRRMRAHLREVRDRIAKRWERLEKEQVGRELNKAAPLPATPGAGRRNHRAATDQRVPLDDRVKAAMTPEDVRTRFLEHELRARRFALLPAVLCWEEDLAQWRSNWQSWSEARAAHRALGLDDSAVVPAPLVAWPPVRPSYLPKAHLPQEFTRGCECPEWCPGRRGDEDILDMWRRCRTSPGGQGGWMKVQAGKPSKGSRSKSGNANGGVHRDSNGCAEEFAVDSEKVEELEEEEEEELRQWGCSADRLPSASKEPPGRPAR